MAPEPTIHRILTDDGVELAAAFRGDAAAPVGVILAHGFTMSGDGRRLNGLAAELAASGRGVYTFDFRGHGHSGGVSSLGDLEILDLDAVIRLARSQQHDKLVVVGASLGAFVALRHAALLGGEDAIVAISTPATWGISPRLRARALLATVRHPLGRRLLSARGTRVIDRVPVPPMSPSELADRITIPVALVHGEQDPYVPAADSILLHQRLAGPKRLVILPRFGHAETAYSPWFAGMVDSLVDELLGGTDKDVTLQP
ncbi:MAG TPA: alpha/beta fold hydrolase [Acidimicrobiales bacterium]|nr:alpha/beta fold hydrolase [Acidimicrobiales bacterium]